MAAAVAVAGPQAPQGLGAGVEAAQGPCLGRAMRLLQPRLLLLMLMMLLLACRPSWVHGLG